MRREASSANLTVKLKSSTLRKLRLEAAAQGKSMSRFLSEMIEARGDVQPSGNRHLEGLELFLSGPSLDVSSGGMPRADERNAR